MLRLRLQNICSLGSIEAAGTATSAPNYQAHRQGRAPARGRVRAHCQARQEGASCERHTCSGAAARPSQRPACLGGSTRRRAHRHGAHAIRRAVRAGARGVARAHRGERRCLTLRRGGRRGYAGARAHRAARGRRAHQRPRGAHATPYEPTSGGRGRGRGGRDRHTGRRIWQASYPTKKKRRNAKKKLKKELLMDRGRTLPPWGGSGDHLAHHCNKPSTTPLTSQGKTSVGGSTDFVPVVRAPS